MRGWGRITNQLASYVPELPPHHSQCQNWQGAPASGTFSAASTMQSRDGGTTCVDNSAEYFIALNDEQFASLLAARDKANAVHAAMTDRNSASQYRKRGT